MFNTDKEYWHRYVPFYDDTIFLDLPLNANILEIGVLDGNSIRMLHSKRPAATIYGVDLLDVQPSWPIHKNIKYLKVDQSYRDELNQMFCQTGKLDLIIDDGSHLPHDQALTLNASLPYIKDGGWYVIEDIHSSFWDLAASSLVLFLALDHCKTALIDVDYDELQSKYYTSDQIRAIDEAVSEIKFFRRATLPLKCFRCNGSSFNYKLLQCKNCKENLYLPYDSMSLALKCFDIS